MMAQKGSLFICSLICALLLQVAECSRFEILRAVSHYWFGEWSTPQSNSEASYQPDESLHFHLIGDYGLYSSPITEANNYLISDIMSEVAQKDPIDFIIGAGDNFYEPNGLRTPDDPRVDIMMNVTYNKPGIANKPWYFALGNHDCYGFPSVEIGLDGKAKNWNFPSNYYEKLIPIDSSGNQALFLVLDGCLLSLKSPSADEVRNAQGFTISPTEREIDEHIQWVKGRLAAHANDDSIAWRSIVVHWPLFSVGFHGDSNSLKENLLKTFFEYNVDIVLSGHDHLFEYINMSRRDFEKYGYADQLDEQSGCTSAGIGLQTNSTLTMDQGEALHQVVAGNCGDTLYDICYNQIVPHENVVFAIAEYGFTDIHIDAERYEIRNYLVEDQGDWRGRVILNRESQ